MRSARYRHNTQPESAITLKAGVGFPNLDDMLEHGFEIERIADRMRNPM